MIFVVELTAAVDDAGTEQVFLFGTEGFATRPTDAPPSTVVLPRLVDPGLIRRQMGDQTVLSGLATVGFGEVLIANQDGALDALLRHGVYRRRIRLLVAETMPAAYPSGWTVLFTGTMAGVDDDGGVLRVRVRDRLGELNIPLCRQVFAGTGNEEGDSSVAGKVKPVLLGVCFNVRPVLIHAAERIYMLSHLPSTQARIVRDGGIGLTLATSNYFSWSDMFASAPSAGQFRRFDVGSSFRLGSAVNHDILCDGGVIDLLGRPGTVISQAAQLADVNEVSASDVAAVNAATSDTSFGYFASDRRVTALQVVADTAYAAGLWVGFDRLGELRMGRLTVPSGQPAREFGPHNALGLRRLPSSPPYAEAETHKLYNWSAGAPTSPSLGLLGKQRMAAEYQQSARGSSGSATLTKHRATETLVYKMPAAGSGLIASLDVEGDWWSPAIAAVSPSQLIDLYGVERDRIVVSVPLTLEAVGDIELGRVVSVRWPRYGFDNGKLFLVTGVTMYLRQLRLDVSLWG